MTEHGAPGGSAARGTIWTIAKKELRGYFNSAVAWVFLAAFIAFAMYAFFWRGKFFARGLADLRPLFEALPLLLIILVAALAMRLWADERRLGTLEVLLTLPVPRYKLVLGKFLAGMILVAIGLGLTLGLPFTVAHMGHLDLGPVIGGYLAALLLSAAYLAIGMCVSAATDNQSVAYVGALAACALLYGLGLESGELGHLLGSGARFESIARGVLDLRDLAYYGTIVVIGLAVNVFLLERVTWGKGERGRVRRRTTLLGLGLVVANALAVNGWLAPVQRARIDLTQDHLYSLSPSTEKILAGLDEPLLIRGYFSAKTHPKLAALIPQIHDFLKEYEIAGHGKVRVEFVDPTDSDDAKREAKERFGIDPTPLRFATQTEKSVVNAYFAIAVEYGDQHAVLGLDDLIDVRVVDVGNVEVTLGNLEYQLTKSIKKTVTEFSSIDSLFASTPGKIQLTAYVTPDTLPENWKDAPSKLDKAVDALKKQAHGKLVYTKVQPKTEDEMRDLYQRFGLRPYQDLVSGKVYYFHLLLQVGDRMVRIVPPQHPSDAELKNTLTEGLKRAAPGFTRVVGLWSPPAPPPMPMMQGMPPRRMPPPQTFETLRQSLAGNYEVRDVRLTAPIADDIDVLVLAGPATLDAKAARVIDQFVMRGGSLVVLDGHYRLAPGNGLSVEKVTTGLDDELKQWGITVGDQMVLDKKSDSFPIPQQRDLGNGMVVRELHQLPYPYFVKMDGDELSSSNLITSGLTSVVLQWASPVKADAKVGGDTHRVETLLRSSGDSWLSSSTEVEPDLRSFPGVGFAGPTSVAKDKRGSRVLALAVSGGFASAVAPAKGAKAKPDAKTKGDHLIAHSPPDTRVVVFGSSAFVSDDILRLAQQLDPDLAAANVELVHNAVDWALADTDLLAIRSHDSASHTITVPPASRQKWETANIAIAAALLFLVFVVAYLRRGAVRPILPGKE